MYKKVVGQFPFQDTELEKVRVLSDKILFALAPSESFHFISFIEGITSNSMH